MKNQKILITGAGGFIGSHVVRAFLNAGAEVYGLVHYNGRNDPGLLDSVILNHIRFHLLRGDLLDNDMIDDIVCGKDVVAHLGAIISIPFSYDNPGLTTQVNVLGTLNILQSCLRHKVKKVIVTSTSEVYGSADNLPITEQHPLKPQSPYAASKVAADALARSFYCSFGLPVVIVRSFNCFGPFQSDRAIIPTIVSQALSGKDEIEVGALHPKRDFTYVEDTARAFLLAAVSDSKLDGETVHFGTGKSYSVREIIDMVQDLIKTKKAVVQAPFRQRPNQSEVLHLLADSSKARDWLNWQPKVSFEEGLKSVVQYVSANLDKYEPSRYTK